VYMDVRTSLSDTAAEDAENVLYGLFDGESLGGEHAGVFEGAVPTRRFVHNASGMDTPLRAFPASLCC
jgi:hypothetical protein